MPGDKSSTTLPTKEQLQHDYVDNKKSFHDIAKEYKTYPNKIRRLAIKYELPIRSKAEAQQLVFKQGKQKHPTLGTHRSNKTKIKIGTKLMENWDQLSEEQKEVHKIKAKKSWDKLTDDQKKERHKIAIKAVQKTAREGSKLEKFLFQFLIDNNLSVEFHKEKLIPNERLQIDMFLPEHSLAIEVDGPSHFKPIWGHDALLRNRKADLEKQGLLLSNNISMIRVKLHLKNMSKSRMLQISQSVLKTINNIVSNPPPQATLFNIEVK